MQLSERQNINVLSNKLAGSSVLIIFLILSFACGYSVSAKPIKRLIRNYNLVHSGVIESGTVIKINSDERGSTRWHRRWPVISFVTTQGEKVTFESLYRPNSVWLSIGRGGGINTNGKYEYHHGIQYERAQLSVGQSVPILYDPKNPQRAEINFTSSLWGGFVLEFSIGGLCFIIAIFLIISIIKDIWSDS